MNTTSPIVSSDTEELVLVNENDEDIGSMPKRDCHLGDGILHRAFSIFIFNQSGDVLLQKRSDQKFLWPGYWSNACCSHPRTGESPTDAAHRRLEQELGIETDLTFLYKFVYRSRFEDIGSEHELCWVWSGITESHEIDANANEIAEWRFVTRDDLQSELAAHPDRFTPWMKMEWDRITSEHQHQIC